MGLFRALPWLCLAACGRLGFDPAAGGGPTTPPGVDANSGGPTAVGLIAYWPMDTAGSFADLVGTHDATCTAGACPTSMAGVVGGAAMFDGTSSCLTVPSLATWADTSFTISAWIQAPAMSGPVVVHESDTSCPSPAMEVTNGAGLVQYNTVGAHSEAWTTAAITSPGQWHQIAVSWDGTMQQVFVDGACDCGIAPANMPVLNPQTFSIGCYPAATTWFTGAIDEVRVYDRVLAADEMAGLYAIAGRSAPAPQPCSVTCATVPP